MDKEKIKSKIEEIIFYITTEFPPSDILITMKHLAEEAIKELSKSDWISVKDKLPPYKEDVNVRMECVFGACYIISERVKSPEQHYNMDYDKNGFRVIDDIYHVTHWKPLEKLEE